MDAGAQAWAGPCQCRFRENRHIIGCYSSPRLINVSRNCWFVSDSTSTDSGTRGSHLHGERILERIFGHASRVAQSHHLQPTRAETLHEIVHSGVGRRLYTARCDRQRSKQRLNRYLGGSLVCTRESHIALGTRLATTGLTPTLAFALLGEKSKQTAGDGGSPRTTHSARAQLQPVREPPTRLFSRCLCVLVAYRASAVSYATGFRHALGARKP